MVARHQMDGFRMQLVQAILELSQHLRQQRVRHAARCIDYDDDLRERTRRACRADRSRAGIDGRVEWFVPSRSASGGQPLAENVRPIQAITLGALRLHLARAASTVHASAGIDLVADQDGLVRGIDGSGGFLRRLITSQLRLGGIDRARADPLVAQDFLICLALV